MAKTESDLVQAQRPPVFSVEGRENDICKSTAATLTPQEKDSKVPMCVCKCKARGLVLDLKKPHQNVSSPASCIPPPSHLHKGHFVHQSLFFCHKDPDPSSPSACFSAFSCALCSRLQRACRSCGRYLRLLRNIDSFWNINPVCLLLFGA